MQGRTCDALRDSKLQMNVGVAQGNEYLSKDACGDQRLLIFAAETFISENVSLNSFFALAADRRWRPP